MPFLDTERQRAAWLVLALGLALVYALWPFSTGLIGAPVLYVVMAPVHRWLTRWLPARVAAGIVVVLAILLVLGPGLSFARPGRRPRRRTWPRGVIRSPLLARISRIRVGPYQVGAQLEQIGSQVVSFIGASALGPDRHGHPAGIQLTITFFGLFYLLVVAAADLARGAPASSPSRPRARRSCGRRFADVTVSTLVGTGVTASVQGLAVGLGVLGGRAFQPAVLGRGDDRLRHPAGGGQRAGLGPGRGGARDGRPLRRRRSGSRSGASWWWATSTTSSGRSSSAAGPRSILSSP